MSAAKAQTEIFSEPIKVIYNDRKNSEGKVDRIPHANM